MKKGSTRTAFIWGAALGLFGATGLVIGNDISWHFWSGAEASRSVNSSGASDISLFLKDVPLEYSVWVDGGEAPAEHTNSGISLSVSQGDHTISLDGPEGLIWTERVAATEPDTLSPHFGGEIAVDVLPQARGGDLYINGDPVGKAPGSLANVTPGWHRVAVMDGEDTLYEEACYVRPGEVTVVSVPPTPPQGRSRLHIKSRILTEIGFQPLRGSTVFLDGEKRGKVPLDLDLPRGFHSIRVEHKTQETVVEVIYLPAGQTRQFLADFGREDRLHVSAEVPDQLTPGKAAAIPVTIMYRSGAVTPARAQVMLVRRNQAEPVVVPLSPVKNDAMTWLAYLPQDLLREGTLRGYASCTDEVGRSGQSELFTVTVR